MTAAGTKPDLGPRTLIVNADDLGMSDGVNRGVVEAHLEGIVTSATAMMNMPASRRGIELAQRAAPELGLGLHVNLSFGRPVLPPEEVGSLVRSDGTFLNVAWGLGMPRRWRRRDIEAEVRAQFDRFVACAGRPPDHLDAHQLVSTLSIPCRSAVLELAQEHGLPVRRGRTSWFGPLERLFRDRGRLPNDVAAMVERVPRFWRQGPMHERTPLSTDGLELRFHGSRATVETLLRLLDALSEGVTELVCHPGYDGGGDDYAFRQAELAALTDRRVREKVAQTGIALATFRGLMHPASRAAR